MEDDLLAYTDRFRTTLETTHRKISLAVLSQLDTDLTRPQLFLLFMIAKEGMPKQSHLAEKMGVKPSAITVMIDRLVQSGHVIRRHHETDRRIVLVEVTDTGKAIIKMTENVQRDVIARGLSELSPEDRHVLVNAFEKLNTYY
ncbi:MarR family transcriptional regulator [Paenibacillus alba]|uniref:MarR family winged helix-turn-helix transcriptional regulator n=1 Tax=Paenibacillus alba TaxID=1197127 RepID=UPI00156439D9|nr:MarR family transcriptional regulator [Paenibacillus alba]NQX70692.1 MarR family transcriptional regulator [Paenibacillus alba]